ncbi:MAG: AMP-binding protein [Rhodospirillaceae bacterium]|jgi:fatty-acyl-CoA synthase|nr:AMP-binding protein [Rhodospirillaceae bacterium]MBT5082076.1 AMP-binding protein [Rhodospirillaceae bacterium]MBT5523549.1 AMP-binding protein [Rhodospirillaceae bacterium]MBT5878992.1 AMP-binding protein [Rhodospirillaceae bacterium]MBT6591006.1 AMP-binding protein [Rhodospirillaceae bacterium]
MGDTADFSSLNGLNGLNLGQVHDAIADAIGDREALVFRDRRFTHGEVAERSRRFANFLVALGITTHTERKDLENWQSGHDHVALYMYNGNEYLECLLGCVKARAAGANINFRYVAEELRYVLNDANAKAIVYHACFAPVVAAVLPQIGPQKALIQVADSSGQPLLPGALDYEDVLAAASPDKLDLNYSPDDLYLLYTGGTTGMPKGVLWRQGDFLASPLGGKRADGSVIDSIDEYVAGALKSKGYRSLPAPPFMHGTGQLIALAAWTRGDGVVLQNVVEHLDPADLLERVETERVNMLALVGDAFARPIVEEMDRSSRDLSSLRIILTSGVILSPPIKAALIERLPDLTIIDTLGSSESGPHVQNITGAKGQSEAGQSSTTEFRISKDTVVFNTDKTALLSPGHEGLGWFAVGKSVPLGYLGDAEKTAQAFPTFNGKRYVVPGDRVRLISDRVIEFHGRDNMTINSGGEKIFVEEVEKAVQHHPSVAGVIVTSRPSERWGSEVIAVVALKNGGAASEEDLMAEAEKHIARYKLPKGFVFVEELPRAANGKPDYQRAKTLAGEL